MTPKELGQYAAQSYLTKIAHDPSEFNQAPTSAQARAMGPSQNAYQADIGNPPVATRRVRKTTSVAKPMGWGGKAAIGAGILGAGALAHKVLSSPEPQQQR